jgi:glycosyltransferase involved in cell wall biosynthesis
MKIGIFLPNATFDLPGSPEVGGIETFAFTVGEAMQRLGHEVILFGGTPKPGKTHRPTTMTLELHPYWETKSIPDIGTRFQRLVQRLHFAWSIRHAWEARRVDLVLLAKPFDWPVAWWWKKSRRELRTFMSFQGTDFFAGDHLFYGAIDAAAAVGTITADLAEKRVGRRPALVPNPVNVDFFTPGDSHRGLQRTEEGDGANSWHIVASGRLVGWKGFANLIEAVARLRDQHQIRARLSLAGDGPERSPLEQRILALNLTDQVTLCGLLDAAALRNLLRTGDLYVQPSIGFESFAISALEGASVGLPLLLSDQVGVAGYLTPEDHVVYPARDVDALTAALKKLHERRTDPSWIDRAARHKRMRAQFSAECVAQQILDLVAKGET